MLIENALADAVSFFHIDALSSSVGMKVDVDMALLVLASGLYRLMARRMRGYQDAQGRRPWATSGHGSVALLREEETNSREESYGKARLESRLVAPGFDGSVRRPIYLRKGWLLAAVPKNAI
jgi:hypothetical protein